MDDDPIELERDRIMRRYGWAVGERELAMAEISARQREIDREERASRQAPVVNVENSHLLQTKGAGARESAVDYSREFETVRREMQSADQALRKAVGQVLGAEFKKHDEELAALRSTIAELTQRIERLETPSGGRALKVARPDGAYDTPEALIG